MKCCRCINGNCSTCSCKSKGQKCINCTAADNGSCENQVGRGGVTSEGSTSPIPHILNPMTPSIQDITAYNSNINGNQTLRFQWGVHDDVSFMRELDLAYNKIVFWRRNLFLLPTGKAGKRYIDETTRLLNAYVTDSPLGKVAFKAIMIMPNLLLQKPSKKSKSKDHLMALERRLELWHKGEICELLHECGIIQKRLKSFGKKDIGQLSRDFSKLMQKGNVNGALKLLTNHMKGGILPLNDETLQLLKQKHPPPIVADDTLLAGPIQKIHPVIFDEIDADRVKTAANQTRGGSGPSGMDADGWKRILTSNSFGTHGSDLRKAIADVCKKLCTIESENKHLEAFTACRLIPLDKNPGLRPIGVGEVLRRIIGKVVMSVVKKDVVMSAGSLQLCAGQVAGIDAAIHAMREINDADDTEAVLLVDASNAFNSLNRHAFLHNISIICPQISIYVNNCYKIPPRLFIIGGEEIISQEGTTQGDPTAMAIYALGIMPLLTQLINTMEEQKYDIKIVAYADDITGAGKLDELQNWWSALNIYGPKFGYNPQGQKSWLIVKQAHEQKAQTIFKDTEIQITVTGQRHLGAVIGSDNYRQEYVEELVKDWVSQLEILSEVANTEPQAAYSAFLSGFRHKVTYFMRTIPDIGAYLQPLEDAMRTIFIPAIMDGHICSDNERLLFSLPPKLGGLGLTIFSDISDIEYANSKLLTAGLTDLIVVQNQTYDIDENELREIKKNIALSRTAHNNIQLEKARSQMEDIKLRLNDANQETGSSNWLTSLPLSDEHYNLNKQQFWDAVRLRYGLTLSKMPENCVCGKRYDVQHALSCKKGGFVSLRHNRLRDLFASLLDEVCRDVQTEPSLQPLTGEHFDRRTANQSDEARLDISARGFWQTGQRAFFDVRVFDSNAQRYGCTDLDKCYKQNETEKKNKYNERVLQIEHGTFTPLVFSVTGGMGKEAHLFVKRLAEMLAEKKNIKYSHAVSWLKTKTSFSLLKSVILCIRGTRSRKENKPQADEIESSEVARQSSLFNL